VSSGDPFEDDFVAVPALSDEETDEGTTTGTVDDAPKEPERAEEEVPELVFASVDEWLRRHWRFTYRRRVSAKGDGTGRWRARYWENDEALQRLEALWRGWEASRQDPGLGTSAWWVNHADPHMSVLLSLSGPFAGSTDENQVGDPLPYARPPAGLFEPDKQPSGIYDDTEY
jgi:hypothetical protein